MTMLSVFIIIYGSVLIGLCTGWLVVSHVIKKQMSAMQRSLKEKE